METTPGLPLNNKKGLTEQMINWIGNKLHSNHIKKKEDTHKMAEANKSFAHFAW